MASETRVVYMRRPRRCLRRSFGFSIPSGSDVSTAPSAPKTASKAHGVGKEPRFQMALGVGIENRRMDFVQTWWQLRLERSQHILWIGRIDIDEHDELIRS